MNSRQWSWRWCSRSGALRRAAAVALWCDRLWGQITPQTKYNAPKVKPTHESAAANWLRGTATCNICHVRSLCFTNKQVPRKQIHFWHPALANNQNRRRHIPFYFMPSIALFGRPVIRHAPNQMCRLIKLVPKGFNVCSEEPQPFGESSNLAPHSAHTQWQKLKSFTFSYREPIYKPNLVVIGSTS